MAEVIFPDEWEKMPEDELLAARAELIAIIKSVDKEKEKSLRSVSKSTRGREIISNKYVIRERERE